MSNKPCVRPPSQWAARSAGLPVNFPAMAHRKRNHHETIVFELANNPIVSDAIAPQTGHFTFQWFAKVPGVLASFDTVVKIIQQAIAYRPVELAELTFSEIADLNRPSQALS
jgi:hypothetical protein